MPPMGTASATGGAGGASGFRYTPPSYLLRTREENRPWVGDENGRDEDDLGVMPQEFRPTKTTTNLDAHFQQRVRAKSNRYRTILKGDDDNANANDNVNTHPVDDESIHDEHQQAVLRAEMMNSNNDSSVGNGMNAQQAAREARKQRLSGISSTGTATTASLGSSMSSTMSGPAVGGGGGGGDVVFGRMSSSSIAGGSTTTSSSTVTASTARSLRAQRLRGHLKQTSEEVDIQTKLEMRRFQNQREEQQLQQQLKLEEESQQRAVAQTQRTLDEERIQLRREREELEQAKREAAFALAHQVRTQQLREASMSKKKRSTNLNNKDTRRNGYYDDNEEDESSTSSSTLEEKGTTSRGGVGSGSGKLSRRARLHAIRKNRKKASGSASRNASKKATTNKAGAGAESESAFVDDITGMLRDSGFLTGCVAQCFGQEDDVVGLVGKDDDVLVTTTGGDNFGSAMTTASSDDSSAAEAAARIGRNASTLQKLNVYAQYRE